MHGVIKLSSPATREFWEIPILFEDEHLLAVDKPAGLLTSPDRYDPERPNLMRLLHQGIARGTPWARERKLTYLANAHRLDPETSGVLLLARSKPVLIQLADQFGCGKPVKTYVALAMGSPRQDTFTVNAALAPHPARPGRMRVDPREGKKSVTDFEVLERFARHTLLRCRPRTGRTDQIRVHLSYRRHPLVGDTAYGGKPLLLSRLKPDYRFKRDREERPLIGRVALHAEALSLPHPVTGAAVTIEAPWPKDLRVAVKYLKLYGAGGGSDADGLSRTTRPPHQTPAQEG